MKLDPKVRFQQSQFRRQLQNAREYKRQPRKIPNASWEIFLDRIGLGNIFARIGLAVFLGLLVYLVYIPNFLYIKSVEVSGLEPEVSSRMTAAVEKYFAASPVKAQKNSFLLSKKSLAEYVLQTVPEVQSISEIKKIYPSGLTIQAEPRVSKFLMKAGAFNYTVSGDGLAQEKFMVATGTTTTSTIPNLIRLEIEDPAGIELGKKVLDGTLIDTFLTLKQGMEQDLRLPFGSFEMKALGDTDIVAHVQNGYKIYFDRNQEARQLLEQTKLLLGNTEEGQKNNLFYIDMRYKDKAFVCYKNTPCTRDFEQLPPPQTSTSTASTTLPSSVNTPID